MKSVKKYFQHSRTETSFALRSTPEPVERHDEEDRLSRLVIINGLVEETGGFSSSRKAENSKLQNVFNHMAETTVRRGSTCRLGKPKGNRKGRKAKTAPCLFYLGMESWEMFLQILPAEKLS